MSSLVSGGGTLFLKTTGKYIGPGQIGNSRRGRHELFQLPLLRRATSTAHRRWTLNRCTGRRMAGPLSPTTGRRCTGSSSTAATTTTSITACCRTAPPSNTIPLLGDVLVLDGTNQFVNLPDGAANGCTFTAVFKWNGGADWQRILDFDRATNKYAFLTPRNAATGNIRFAITASGPGRRARCWTEPMPRRSEPGRTLR